MRLISEDINNLVRQILAKKDPILAEIILNWTKIVGSKYSFNSIPVKITKSKEKGEKINILHLQTSSSSLSLELSFQQNLIVERIVIYLGYKAIHKIKISTVPTA